MRKVLPGSCKVWLEAQRSLQFTLRVSLAAFPFVEISQQPVRLSGGRLTTFGWLRQVLLQVLLSAREVLADVD